MSALESPINMGGRARLGEPVVQTPDLGCVHTEASLALRVPFDDAAHWHPLFVVEASVHPATNFWVPCAILDAKQAASGLLSLPPARRYRLVWADGPMVRLVECPPSGENPTGERLEVDPAAEIDVEAWLHLSSVAFLGVESIARKG